MGAIEGIFVRVYTCFLIHNKSAQSHYFTTQGTLFSLKGLLDRKYQLLQDRKLTHNTKKPQIKPITIYALTTILLV